jgi:hypothetical protein
VLLAGAALAQNAGTGESVLRVPVGQTFRQFSFPVYGPDGQLHYSFFATEATGVTINRAETTNLRIDVYENGQRTTTITSPKADLYVAEQKMRTKNTVQIERADMEATSQDCDFDVKSKKFLLRTNVKVLLKHFDVGGGSFGATKTGTMRSGAKAPSATAPPGPASPMLPAGTTLTPLPPSETPKATDDSILPSPGAYSDTNAAPLPPSSPTK